MSHIRHLSLRPVVIVDRHGNAVGEADAASRVGYDGPFGRERVLFALPMGGTGPVRLSAPIVWTDRHGRLIADPDQVVTGRDGVVVSRFLTVTKTEDTRRL